MSLSGWRWLEGAANPEDGPAGPGTGAGKDPPHSLQPGAGWVLVEGHISLRRRIQRIVRSKCLGGELSPLAESLPRSSLGQKGWLPPEHASGVPSHQPPTLLSQEPSHFSGTPSLNSSITHHSHNFAECPRWGRGRG